MEGQGERSSRRTRAAARHLAQYFERTLPVDELERFAHRLGQQVATVAPDAPDNRDALVARLSGGVILTAAERAALEAWAILARSQDRRDLLAGSLKTSDVARLLGRSRQAVHDRVKAGTLLAIDDGGELRYPPWQFDPAGERGVVSGLPEVLAALRVEPLSKARWLMRPNALFEGRTPLQALKDADKELVVAAARGVSVDA